MLALLLAVALVQDSVPSTYSFVACREPCTSADTAGALATGFIVLAPNHSGCFEIAHREDYHSYLAVHRHGYTRWEWQSDDSLVFWTYRGPDASHVVRAIWTDTGFVGRGHSAGPYLAPSQVPDEFIVGRRLGPPDPNRCRIYRDDRRSRWAGPLLMMVAAVGLGFALAGSK